MNKKHREIIKIDADIRSAAKAFLGLRMEDLLLRVDELDDKDRKKQLIEEYFHNQIGTSDKSIGGTTTRVNSAVRIIKAGKVLYALEKIRDSDSRVSCETVSKAKETIRKIKSGELMLPPLN